MNNMYDILNKLRSVSDDATKQSETSGQYAQPKTALQETMTRVEKEFLSERKKSADMEEDLFLKKGKKDKKDKKDKVDEAWEDMEKYLKDKEKSKGTGKFEKTKTDKGTKYTKKAEKDDDDEQIDEAWEDMEKYLKDKEKSKGTGKFEKTKTDKGTKYTKKAEKDKDDDDETQNESKDPDTKKSAKKEDKKHKFLKIDETIAIDRVIAEAYGDFFEDDLEEDDMEEGNEFSGELKKARDAGKKEFEVDGKKYKVSEDKDEDGKCEDCGCDPCECDDKKVDEAVRGTYLGRQGYRAPETQDERNAVASNIKYNRAQNRADTRVSGYGNRIAPQRGVASADTGGARGSAINVDHEGYATDFEPNRGNIDPRAQGYRGALNLGKSPQGKGVTVHESLDVLKKLAGFDVNKKQLNECGMSAPMGISPVDTKGRMNVSTNMSSDGNKNVTITADGDAANELMQMLKLAGMNADASFPAPTIAVVGNDSEESIEPMDNEEMSDDSAEQVYDVAMSDDSEDTSDQDHEVDEASKVFGNTPGGSLSGQGNEKRTFPTQALTKGGDGELAGKEKKMHRGGSARFSDNPMAFEDVFSDKFLKEYSSIFKKKLNESSLKLKKVMTQGHLTAKVYKDVEWGEFVVKYFENGQVLPDSTWTHTDDYEDAVGTAQAELNHMSK